MWRARVNDEARGPQRRARKSSFGRGESGEHDAVGAVAGRSGEKALRERERKRRGFSFRYSCSGMRWVRVWVGGSVGSGTQNWYIRVCWLRATLSALATHRLVDVMARKKTTLKPLKASTPSTTSNNNGRKKKTAMNAVTKKQQQAQLKSLKKPAKVVKQLVKKAESEEVEEKEEESEDDDEVEKEGDGDASETEDSDDVDDEEEDDEFEDQGSSSDDDDDSGDDEPEDADLTELEKKTRRFTVDREKEVQKMREDGSLSVASQLHVDDLSSDDEIRCEQRTDICVYGPTAARCTMPIMIVKSFFRTVTWKSFDGCRLYVDVYSSNKIIHSMGNDIEPKSRFLPSKWERMKVLKIMKGIKEGRIKLDQKLEKKPEVYQMWFDDDQSQTRKGPAYIQAPKMPLPGHIESYNPPDEYLFSKEERHAWETANPEERETNFMPKRFKSLRELCGYSGFVRDRFERCLDLYLAPRVNKRKLNIDPESLVPELPKPQDLRPFPNTLALVFNGHTGRIRSLAVDPYGQYVASGSDDSTVRIWELETARCLQVYNVGAVVHKLSWNPNKDHQLLAVAAAKKVFIIATGTGSADQTELTNVLVGDADDSIRVVEEASDAINTTSGDVQVVDEADATVEPDALKKKVPVTWRFYSGTNDKHTSSDASERPWLERRVGTGIRVVLHHTSDVKDVAWHHKGDYLSTVSPGAGSGAVLIHQLSKRKTQNPFQKSLGQVQCILFHPSKPFFFHATQRHVRVYNLVKQSIVKKLSSGVKWISSMAVHPNGDHLLVGSYDRRLCWFDLDLSSRPFKTLKYHEKAVRDVSFHAKYPLMASASDDGTIHIFHAMVYSDLMKNPLIVPLKILRGHEVSGGLGVMALAFHPVLPWVVTGGADGTIRLFQNLH
uniref:Ribosome biogenesis protein BOP1 homolog n=1 Tax=Hyaloperonospora arabidopsidis (strain Emoy2) TaxID=559515 RepID=M4B710_HYAAE